MQTYVTDSPCACSSEASSTLLNFVELVLCARGFSKTIRNPTSRQFKSNDNWMALHWTSYSFAAPAPHPPSLQPPPPPPPPLQPSASVHRRMGNSQGQLKSSRFEAALHTSIEHSLRSHNAAPQPVFSQLYLEKDVKPVDRLTTADGGMVRQTPVVLSSPHTSHPPQVTAVLAQPPHPQQQQPPTTDVPVFPGPFPGPPVMQFPHGMHTTVPTQGCQEVGFCQKGADIRLTELSDKQIDVQEGYVLVGTKSPYLPENILIAAVDKRFLPDPNTNLALLGFSGNCVGCGEKGFRYFTEFSHHINLKLTTQPKKQKHLKYYIIRNKQGQLVRGEPIDWKECRKRGPARPVPPSVEANGIQPSAGLGTKSGPPRLQSKSSVSKHRGDGSADGDSTQPPLKKRPLYFPAEDGVFNSARHPHEVIDKFNRLSMLFSTGHHLPLASPNYVPAPPTATTHDSVFIQPGLINIVRCKPVILPCHGNMAYLHGNVVDVVVSPLFHDCFKLPQLPPAVLDSMGLLGGPTLSVETMALITIQYLVQLGTRVPSREELDAAFLKARLESVVKDRPMQQTPPAFVTVAPAQLPWLARMSASTSRGRVKVIVPQVSLAEGVNEAMRLLCNINPNMKQPLYVVVIHVSRQRGTEFCVIVSGPLQARVLLESHFSIPECFKEISYQIITGKIHLLHTHFKRNSPENLGDDVLLDNYAASLKGNVFLPFNGGVEEKVREDVAVGMKACAVPANSPEDFKLHPVQIAVAMKILSQVCAIADSDQMALDLGRFSKVDLMIITAPSLVARQQTVERLAQSGLLVDLGLEEVSSIKAAENHVMRCDKSPESQAKFENFVKRVKSHPYTLFVLIQDQAHIDINRHSFGAQPLGLADRYINCPEILESPNALTLQVTPTPYVLQTKKSRLSPHNEVYMPTSVNQMTNVLPPEKVYFGLQDYIKTTEWTERLPLLRYDNDFEQAANTLLAAYPRLHSMVIRTYLLIRQYTAALMSLCGIKDTKKNSTTETYNMINEMISAPMQNDQGRGIMILLRIPSLQLALLAHERLRSVRDKLGWQYRFDILLSSMTTEFTIDEHFVSRLQSWQGADKSWQPKTYEDLNDLPCIMILSGQHTAGETWPKSLRYSDLRLVNTGALDRTTVEQEIGLVCQYIDVGSIHESVTVCELSEEEDSDTDDNDGDESEADPIIPPVPPALPLHGPPALEPINKTPSLDGQSQRTLREPLFSSPSDTVKKPPSSDQTIGMLLQSHTSKATDHESAKRMPSPVVDAMDGVQMSSTDKSSDSEEKNGFSDDPPPMLKIDWEIGGVDEEDEEEDVSDTTVEAAPLKTMPPVILVSQTAFNVLKPDTHHSMDRLMYLNLPASRDSVWVSSLRPTMQSNMTNEVKSMFYRQWTEPKNYHYDYERKIDNSSQLHHLPRRLLLCGPHQVGKTGAFLHFARVLSRMLIRLQEVEVYDEEEVNMEGSSSILQPPQSPTAKWPDFELISQMPFDAAIHQRKLILCSPICGTNMKPRGGVFFSITDTPFNVSLFHAISVAGDDEKIERPTTSMMMSQYSAHNAFHHCEQCQHYKDIPVAEAQQARTHRFTFTSAMYGEDLEMQFVIPPQQEKHFVFNHSTGQLESMLLPVINEKGPNAIKTPIFTPTSGRHEHGLINLFHAVGGAKHLHILVVKQSEMVLYKKQWPNHILLVLPAVANDNGIGAARFFIKELAFHNLELERSRQQELGVRRQDVWPFILMLDDSCVMWHCHDSGKIEDGKDTLVTLKQVLEHIESTPKLSNFAMFGIRQWTSKNSMDTLQQNFSRCHLHNMVFINVNLTKNVQYDQNRYFCEDVDFNMRINSCGFVVCRFNQFSVMKKHISVGGQREFPIQPKSGTTPEGLSPQHFVCAPDSEDMTALLGTPQYLLEKYLACVSAEKLFPLAANYPQYPVLVVDHYINLGPSITVHYASSKPHSSNLNDSSLRFSGLLLYMVDSFVMADFIKQFKFVSGAKLCLISPDRNTLRRQVVRLELEDQWRFRLRDEFQTANSAEDKPLFLLTGTHVE
ncbi:GREB1-like protein [Ptychodera flava]|uniref:GREB1-like protein n=1 Tax=Ptychodera flava TaxID=63121 RepID=UPI003969D15E